MKESIELKTDDLANNIFGSMGCHLKIIENEIPVILGSRGRLVHIEGSTESVELVKKILKSLEALATSRELENTDITYALELALSEEANNLDHLKEIFFTTIRGKNILAKTLGQYDYLKMIEKKTITFGIGPAGTGKTFLAVVMAVRALKRKEVERIILTRPAVEAGEKLGFLPGDLQEKIDPYLRPLYDALYFTLGQEMAEKYLERGIIELAPLAYMRGRTLDDAFIILDEAQNTTSEQMKMFLTRIGYGSKAVVTGDITQIDLPKVTASGLIEASEILGEIKEIGFSKLIARDVVRHPVVAKIIKAYDKLS